MSICCGGCSLILNSSFVYYYYYYCCCCCCCCWLLIIIIIIIVVKMSVIVPSYHCCFSCYNHKKYASYAFTQGDYGGSRKECCSTVSDFEGSVFSHLTSPKLVSHFNPVCRDLGEDYRHGQHIALSSDHKVTHKPHSVLTADT